MLVKNKTIGLFKIAFLSISAVLVTETIAASALIGPSAIFWWIFMFFLFFFPYGLITTELSTTHSEEGGLYHWVYLAYGSKWAARTAWYYYLNFVLWIPSVFYLFAIILNQFPIFEFSNLQLILIAIAISWIATFAQMIDVEKLIFVPIIGAAFKMILMLGLGVLGIFIANKNGWATQLDTNNMFSPSLVDGLGFLPVIIFNFMGFEIIAGAMSAMKKPNKDIPLALLIGGLSIASLYIIATIGLFAIIPYEQIDKADGVIQAYAQIFNGNEISEIIISIVSIMLLYTLFANIVTWAIGVNRVMVSASKNKDMPKTFNKVNSKTGVPTTVAIWNSLIATFVLLGYYFLNSIIDQSQYHKGINSVDKTSYVDTLFWNLFSLGAVFLLFSYTLLFPTYLKLRKNNKKGNRTYQIPGGKYIGLLIAWLPLVLLIVSFIALFYVPGDKLDYDYITQVGSGVILFIAIGEVLIWHAHKKKHNLKTQKQP